MPLTSVTKDAAKLTLTVVGDFPVPQQRLWDAYADPRQLERFWGPPTWPATFTRHDLKVGGRAEYFMTGPNGRKVERLLEVHRGESNQLVRGARRRRQRRGREHAGVDEVRLRGHADGIAHDLRHAVFKR